MHIHAPLALLLLALPVSAAGLPSRSKPAIYLQGTRSSASARSPADAGPDFDDFVRTYLQLRLLQAGKVITAQEQEPPCGTSSAQQPTPENESRAGRDSGIPLYFRAAWSVQPRYDSTGKALDIAFSYDVFKIVDCDPKSIDHDSRAFPMQNALGEIRAAAEAMSNAIKTEVTERLRIFVAVGNHRDTKSGAAFQRAINYALSDADGEYQFVTETDRSEADYTVESDVRVTKNNGGGTAYFNVSVGDSAGQNYKLPAVSFPYSSDKDLPAAYFDVGNSIASAISEIQDRRLAGVSGINSDVTAAVVARQANALLCRIQESAKDCEARPRVALAVLNSLPANQSNRLEIVELRGAALLANEAYALAGKEFDLALDGIPQSDLPGRLRLLHLAGSAWYSAQAYDKAVDRFRQDLSLRQESQHELPLSEGPQANEYVDLIRAYTKLKRFDEAVKVWSEAVSSEAVSNGGSTADLEAEVGPILNELKGDDFERGVVSILGSKSISKPLLQNLHEKLGAYLSEKRDYARAGSEYAAQFEVVQEGRDPQPSALVLAANKAGLAFSNAHQYEEGLRWHRTALDWGKKTWGPKDPSVFVLTNNVASQYLRLVQFKKAEDEVAPLVAALENDTNETKAFANALDIYAIALAGESRYDEARTQYDRLAKLQARTYGPSSPEYAEVLNSIGRMYDTSLQLNAAVAAYAKALPVMTAAYGKNSPRMIAILTNIGVVHQNLEDFDGALAYYLQSLALPAPADGSNWADEAMTRFNVSNIYSIQLKTREAKSYAEAGLKIAQAHNDMYRIAVGLQILGKSEEASGLAMDTADLYRRSVESYEKAEPENRWHAALALEDLAQNEVDRGEFVQAEKDLARADQILTSRWGATHSRRAPIMRIRANIAMYEKRFTAAESLIAEADTLFRTRDEDASKGLEYERAGLALARGDFTSAEEHSRVNFEYRRGKYNNDPAMVFKSRNLFARALAKKGDAVGARKLVDNKPPNPWPQLIEGSIHWAAAVYSQALVESLDSATGDHEKATALFRSAERVYRSVYGSRSPLLVSVLRDEAAFFSVAGNAAEASTKTLEAEAAEKDWLQ